MAIEFALISETLHKTALHDWHVNNGGRMVDFAGWSMPVQYGSIIQEHEFTRQSVGLFDVSHMGRLVFDDAAGSLAALERLSTRRVDTMSVGQIRYSLLTNDDGGVLDDVLIYRLPDATGGEFVMLVCNASNRAKIVQWLNDRLPNDVTFEDRTARTAMIAVQGPAANALVAKRSEADPSLLAYYTGTTTQVAGHSAIMTRTGYTGEDGCELIVDDAAAVELWKVLHADATDGNGGACGLASRDTLRLEASMPLYGHELNEQINAAQTKLNFAINLKDRDFPGRDAIAAARTNDALPVRVGLELAGKRAARQDCPVVVGDQTIGTVTSGAFAPTVERSILMAYVDPSFAATGTKVNIDIRGKLHPAIVVKLPFYSRES